MAGLLAPGVQRVRGQPADRPGRAGGPGPWETRRSHHRRRPAPGSGSVRRRGRRPRQLVLAPLAIPGAAQRLAVHRHHLSVLPIRGAPARPARICCSRANLSRRAGSSRGPRCPSTPRWSRLSSRPPGPWPHPCCSAPDPGDQQERGVGNGGLTDRRPAMRIITGPTAQLGLDLPYSLLRLNQRVRGCVDAHRRPPGIPASPLMTCWPPSPCARLSRTRTTTEPPPHPTATSRQRTCPPPDWLPAEGRPRMVPTFTTESLDEGAPALTPTACRAYAPDLQHGLLTGPTNRLRSWPTPHRRRRPRAAHRPISVRLEPALDLRGVKQRFLAYAFSSPLAGPEPSDRADSSRTLSGLLQPSRGSHAPAAPTFTSCD